MRNAKYSPGFVKLAAALAVCLFLVENRDLCDAQEPSPADQETVARTLFEEGQWEGVLTATSVSGRREASAELEYYRGMSLARLGRLDEARLEFQSGRAKAPLDKRFPIELAGIAFKQGDRDQSRRLLMSALRIDSSDGYCHDFLGTIFFLNGNLEAALKHWNGIGKPRIVTVATDPRPRLDPVLLDRSFAFSPGSLLTEDELEHTRANLDLLETFDLYRFRLLPRPDGFFDLQFQPSEKSSWVNSRIGGLIETFREIPYQTIHLDAFDLRRSAWNVESSVRWDERKRRVFAGFTAPVHGNPKWNLAIRIDDRKENWEIDRAYRGAMPAPGPFWMNTVKAEAQIRSVVNGSWYWQLGAALSDRKFASPPQSDPALARLFTGGMSLTYGPEVRRLLIHDPERRLKAEATASGKFGKVLGKGTGAFGNLRAGLEWSWLPLPAGDDYAVNGRCRLGKSIGAVPFDELFSLGVERDNDLLLRGHGGLDNGRKGAGPLGRDFALVSLEADKILYRGGFARISIGPFLDSGGARDGDGVFGTRGWQFDTGLQMKLSVLGMAELQASYGRALRSGGGAFDVRLFRRLGR